MRECEIAANLSGYEYQFSNRASMDGKCTVCHLKMKALVQNVSCEHRFCKTCMESLFRRPLPTCPADRQPLSSERIIPNRSVKCSNVGCPWIGDQRAEEKHQSECLLKVVRCPNSGCTENFTKQDMTTHAAFDCSWRKMDCKYCGETFIKNQRQEHFDVCKKFPVQCTNHCGFTDIPREKLEVHIQDECPNTEVYCEFKLLGCEAKFPRSNTQSHLESNVEFHLNIALRGLEATRHRVRSLVGMVKDQSKKIERLEKGVSKDRDQSQPVLKRKKATECSLFVWKISNFQAVCERARSGKQEVILSEPFYLTKNGYRYQIKMMPNGGEAASTHVTDSSFKGLWLSLFVKVVPGEFDSLLSWPCKEKIRLTMIDPNRSQDKKKNISTVIDLGRQECPRPLSERGEGIGCPDFVSQGVLRNGAYVKNDAIFVMASKV